MAPNSLNQYATVAGVSYGYDGKGNLTSDGLWTFAYDAENRLLTASKTGVAAAYAYDPLGRRTRKSGTGVTAAYYVSSGTDEIAEYNSSGSLVTRYVPGPAIDEPIAQVTAAGATTYFHTNKQGSVIAMSGTGAAKSEGPYTYDAYGNCFLGATANACTSAGEPYRFTSRRFDPETGLTYYRARYYSASLGRFLETDPVGYTADLNLYAYVGNDPVNMTDPTGMYSCGSSLSSGQCSEFTKAQDAAKSQISGAIGELKTLRTDLASRKLSAQDKAVSAALDKYLGKGAGSSAGSISRLVGAATKMLGSLNSNIPAEFGRGGGSAYANSPGTQLTLYSHFFAKPGDTNASIQRAQTVAHESAHQALGAVDWPLMVGNTYIGPYGQTNALNRARLWPEKTWEVPDSLTFSLGFHRTDEPEQWP